MASAEFTSPESTQAVPTLETPSDQEQVNVDTSTNSDIESTAAIFQAVGVITGSVNFTTDGQSTVTIGSYEYPLYYSKVSSGAGLMGCGFSDISLTLLAIYSANLRVTVYGTPVYF